MSDWYKDMLELGQGVSVAVWLSNWQTVATASKKLHELATVQLKAQQLANANREQLSFTREGGF